MKYKLLRYLSIWIVRKDVLRYVLIFSLFVLSFAIYRFARQSNWLENEFAKQVQDIQIKNDFAQQVIYLHYAGAANRKYVFSGSPEIGETLDVTIDSVLAINLRLRYLLSRTENEINSLLFFKSDALIQQRVEFLRQVKKLCDDSNRVAAMTLIATNKGRLLSDSILAINSKISNNLQEELKKSQTAFLKENRANNLIALGGITISLFIIALAFSFFLKLTAKVQRLNTELELRVVKRTDQLETANKELEAFSYSVSHDLRAPLRAISGYSAILKEDYGSRLDEEANNIINILSESAKHMGQLIDDLLKFSQLGRLDAIQSDVDMNRIIQNTVKDISAIKDTGKYNIVVQKLPACTGDANMLKQVWFNLIDNAFKYSATKENPIIEIGCQESQKEFTYFVKDNGVGFDMTFVDKLFGVFQRLHRKDEFEGNGLGLSLVKRIIEKHRGRVFAVSVLQNGSTFYFTIPKYSL